MPLAPLSAYITTRIHMNEMALKLRRWKYLSMDGEGAVKERRDQEPAAGWLNSFISARGLLPRG
jgi:hypothetical protein